MPCSQIIASLSFPSPLIISWTTTSSLRPANSKGLRIFINSQLPSLGRKTYYRRFPKVGREWLPRLFYSSEMNCDCRTNSEGMPLVQNSTLRPRILGYIYHSRYHMSRNLPPKKLPFPQSVLKGSPNGVQSRPSFNSMSMLPNSSTTLASGQEKHLSTSSSNSTNL